MKAVCEGIELSDAVLKVVKACSTKTGLPDTISRRARRMPSTWSC